MQRIARVVCPQGKSRAFKDGTGVRQGGLESPDLFDIFTDELLVYLKSTGIGIGIGDETIPGATGCGRTRAIGRSTRSRSKGGVV